MGSWFTILKRITLIIILLLIINGCRLVMHGLVGGDYVDGFYTSASPLNLTSGVKVVSDADVSIYDIRYVITRTHKAR